MSNCAEYLAIWLGLTRIGVVVALINSQLAGEVLAHSINIARAQGADRRRRSRAASRRDPRASACGSVLPGAMVEHAESRAARARARGIVGRATASRGVRACRPLDATALIHLYLGHHRPAEGGQGQPLPAHAVEPLVCRHDGHAARGSHVQLPAALPQRRRRGRDVCDAGERRRRGDSTAVFGVGFLARRARRTLHVVSIHRRTMPLPGQHAAPGTRNRAFAADRLRQWPAAGGLGAVPEPLSRFRESSSITHPPKAISRSTTARANRAPSAAYRRFSRIACRWRCCDSTLTRRSRGATPTGSASVCAANEVGEAVGLDSRRGGERAGRFEGYADPDASARKVLRNVFKEGDSWYRTGDLMRRDERGFYLLRRSGRRNLSLERRERFDRGGVDARSRRAAACSTAWSTASRCPAPMAARVPPHWW